MVFEIQFNYCSFENVTNLISVHMDGSINLYNFYILIQQQLKQIKEVLNLLFQMLENMCKTLNHKAQFLHSISNRNIMQAFKLKTSRYENKALKLIEQQLYIRNILALLYQLMKIHDRSKIFAFNALKDTYLNDNKEKQKSNMRLELTLFYTKIKKVLFKKEHGLKLLIFKTIKAFDVIKKQGRTYQSFKQGQMVTQTTNYMNMSKNTHRFFDKQKNKNMLSNLDISQIQINNHRQAMVPTSVNQISYLQINNIHKNEIQIRGLKNKINQKEQYLKQFEIKQKQEIYLLQSKLTQNQNKKLQESIHSKNDLSNIEISWRKNNDNKDNRDDNELIGKLIKRNYELQQKLQQVYQLLEVLQPDPKTKFGRELGAIIRKKCFHISFQDQNQ